MKRFDIRTRDGEGEAIQENQGEAWHISIPMTDFIWYGSVLEIKKEVQRRCPGATFQK